MAISQFSPLFHSLPTNIQTPTVHTVLEKSQSGRSSNQTGSSNPTLSFTAQTKLSCANDIKIAGCFEEAELHAEGLRDAPEGPGAPNCHLRRMRQQKRRDASSHRPATDHQPCPLIRSVMNGCRRAYRKTVSDAAFTEGDCCHLSLCRTGSVSDNINLVPWAQLSFAP